MTRRLRLDRPHPLRAGAVPVWIPLLAVVLLFAAGVRAMERRAQSEGYGWVDPASLEFEAFAEWVDERWTMVTSAPASQSAAEISCAELLEPTTTTFLPA